MEQIGAVHTPLRKPNGITKADREARKSDDLLERNFSAEKPCEKCVTDITEIPAKDGKLYVSAIFDCYDALVLEIAMADNMRAELCVQTVENAYKGYPDMCGAVLHSDRGSQYTSEKYRSAITNLGINLLVNAVANRDLARQIKAHYRRAVFPAKHIIIFAVKHGHQPAFRVFYLLFLMNSDKSRNKRFLYQLLRVRNILHLI